MKKEQADKLILQYQKKIFGFALERLQEIARAEELASDIICEVYISFLKKDDIVNVDGYVYRIARNVYANYVRKLVEGRGFEDIHQLELPYYDKDFEEMENEEMLIQLRREIGFLSERQRTILYLHYYDKKSVAEIAHKLNISQGTVKWHLSDARSTLKEELLMEREKDTLAVNPIRFDSMGHNGYAGSRGDTKDIFDTQLKQNIAYACYYTSLTVEEIARKLSVPAIYVRDEIQVLEEYGYLDKMDNSKNPKYRTNMYIVDGRLFDDTESKIRKEAAKFLCDHFYPQIFADFDAAEDNWGFSCEGNDKNFMKYSLVMLFSLFALQRDTAAFDKYRVKRPDGGCFIAHASIRGEVKNAAEERYWVCGYMNQDVDMEMVKLQLDCAYADRSGGWRDDLDMDVKCLYHFIKGGSKAEAISPEGYKRLCDRGYLHDNRVQLMTYKLPAGNQKWGMEVWYELINEKVQVPEKVESYAESMGIRMYEYAKDKFPEHIHPLVKLYSINPLGDSLMIPYILEEMLERGMLKYVTDVQRKGVLSIIMYQED